uniref:Uncharacterized protein n=1 Tax=Anguilla anguilla TaxID=7936 RepID=A0A0E9PYJ9_ANGAN
MGSQCNQATFCPLSYCHLFHLSVAVFAQKIIRHLTLA